jgi:hypothetical protein
LRFVVGFLLWCDFLIFLVQGYEWRWKLVEVGYGVSMVGLWCFYGVFVNCLWEQRWHEIEREKGQTMKKEK